MRSASGQATLEYLAVVAVLGVVLGGVATAGAGRGLADAVHTGLVRALCVVAAGHCTTDLEPCPTAWRRDGRTWGARLLVVRLAGDAFVVRERRSDGTVAVTLGQDGSGGVEVALGRRVGVLGLEARAGALSGAERASTWVLPDDRAADRLLARLARWRHAEGPGEPDVREPDVTYVRRGRRGGVGAEAVLRPFGVHAAVEAGVVRGFRHDRTTGRTTAYLQHAVEASATARAAGRRGRGRRAVAGDARTSGLAGAAERIAVTVDRRGQPVELQLLRIDPSGAVPAEAAAVSGLLPAGRRGRVVVTEQRLDLTDAANRAAAAATIAALLAGGGEPRLPADLAARLRSDAVVHVRAYAVRRRRREIGGTVGAGSLQVGGSRGTAVEEARLVAAVTRRIGGSWARRSDCAVA